MRIAIIFLVCTILTGCAQRSSKGSFIEPAMEVAVYQLEAAIAHIPDTMENYGPVALHDDGSVKYMRNVLDWRVGFFPGSLWYLYDYTRDEQWKQFAERFTLDIEEAKYNTRHHDVGFMIECSFGNGYRLTKNDHYKDVMIEAARSLSTRFDPRVGAIMSWSPNVKLDRQYPVIIDNMMNLELLFNVTELTGDSTFYNIAVSHADIAIRDHYRPDYSCYHVVDYDSITGEVRSRKTAQGYADESSWARGQAWGLYGFAMCYRETGYERYLEQAEHIANWWLTQATMPEDGVPYWDFDAPNIPDEPRDASAAAIAASAFLELASFNTERSDEYLKVAEKTLASLASPAYLAEPGENGYFILKHSVTSFPGNSEIDVPLNYADYYFLEALLRYQKMM
ncbi:MAG: glucuronyl hydrolase [Bacteroidales bacterium]|nr:glucuronyl hydrolase [Bacteroidales bacterium]